MDYWSSFEFKEIKIQCKTMSGFQCINHFPPKKHLETAKEAAKEDLHIETILLSDFNLGNWKH